MIGILRVAGVVVAAIGVAKPDVLALAVGVLAILASFWEME